MPRKNGKKKVTMEYTCKRRSIGMIKKASELSTLCGIKVCLIIFPEGGESSQMHVWPSLEEATSTIDLLRSMPEGDQRRKMDGEGYVRERIGKIKEQMSKAVCDNRQRETMLLLHDAMVGHRPNLDGLTVEQLVSIGWMTENLIKKIKDSIAYRSGQQADPQQ